MAADDLERFRVICCMAQQFPPLTLTPTPTPTPQENCQYRFIPSSLPPERPQGRHRPGMPLRPASRRSEASLSSIPSSISPALVDKAPSQPANRDGKTAESIGIDLTLRGRPLRPQAGLKVKQNNASQEKEITERNI